MIKVGARFFLKYLSMLWYNYLFVEKSWIWRAGRFEFFPFLTYKSFYIFRGRSWSFSWLSQFWPDSTFQVSIPDADAYPFDRKPVDPIINITTKSVMIMIVSIISWFSDQIEISVVSNLKSTDPTIVPDRKMEHDLQISSSLISTSYAYFWTENNN